MFPPNSAFAAATESSSCFSFLDCGEEGSSIPAFNQPTARDESKLEMKPLEDMLASEIAKLSVQERSKALDDVHCVGDELQETPEVLQQSLAEFDEVLQRKKTSIYEMATNQSREYVENPTFRLLFLRANLHDVGKSVHQMLDFLRYKATYFGNDKVARDITLDDLNEEDKRLLLSGAKHIQEGTDRSGRFVLYFFNHCFGIGTIDNHVRVMYYILFNILAQNPAVQKKGLVSCYYDITKPGQKVPKPGVNFLMAIMGCINTLPIRFPAIHGCVKAGANVALNKHCLEISYKLLPEYMKARTRMHYGTDLELQYQLRGHGIPIETFPVDADGNMRKGIQNAWFYKHQEAMIGSNAKPCDRSSHDWQESDDDTAQSLASSPTTTPPRHCILMGRGKPIQNHPGNVCFREYLKQFNDEYNEAPRHLRRRILRKVREDLNSREIRFLQERGDGKWVECSAAEAEKTIGQAFRNRRRQSKRDEPDLVGVSL